MATTLESPSPASFKQQVSRSSNPSPSDKCFWTALLSRFDALTENPSPVDRSLSAQMNVEAMEQARRLKQASKLLFRGFDSTVYSLSQLSNNLENAHQGARDLTRPPTFTEILEAANIGKAKSEDSRVQQKEEDNQLDMRRMKRKLNSRTSTGSEEEEKGGNSHNVKGPYEMGKFKKAKNLATCMANNETTMAGELQSVRSKLKFMEERCALLEEENKKLRHGLPGGIPPDDEDDLVRLQLEALMAEKSRLANENANLTRENQRLHQLLGYHQLTSQDLSASYDNTT